MIENLDVVVLAAGLGTRLGGQKPKPLVKCAGRSLCGHILKNLAVFQERAHCKLKVTFVVGHKKEEVMAEVNQQAQHWGVSVDFVHQEEQLGTAHAVECYLKAVDPKNLSKSTLIMCGDTPRINGDCLVELQNQFATENLDALVASFKAQDPFGYGRIIRDKKGIKIVEQKDTTKELALIDEVNSGLYLFNTPFLKEAINKVKNSNEAGEFYLTDLMELANQSNAYCFPDEGRFLGVNDFSDLAKIEKLLFLDKIHELLKSGVRIIDPNNTYIEDQVRIGPLSVIYPNCYLSGSTEIGSEVVIGMGSMIEDSKIRDASKIKAYSVLESSVVGREVQAGPFARLRPETELGDQVKIGNFVEIKKSKFHKGAKSSHLAYIGDAEIGENTNLGCGFITCNYDGVKKHKTKIGSDSFIGSDTQMIAPVEIGDRCFVASGSTINQSMPDEAFAIARQKQVIKEKLAPRFLPPTNKDKKK